MRFAIGESVVAVSLPSFEVVEDGSVVACEELCDAGCAPVLCGESDGESASSDFWVCVWVVEQLLELRVFVWCQLNEYRCSHVEIIPQRHLLVHTYKPPRHVYEAAVCVYGAIVYAYEVAVQFCSGTIISS